MTRNATKDFFIKRGAKVMTSFSKTLDFVIVGKKPSLAKLNKVNNDNIININNKKDLLNYD